MTRVITIASGKGGVGKTTLTANLGIALTRLGYRVCLLDADVAMANLSLLLGMHSSPITLHDVLLGEASVQDAIYEGPEGVKFVPSGLSLENYRRVDTERLGPIVQSIAPLFDFVLLDAPAGIEKNVLSALAAGEEILLVTQPTSASIADVLKIKITAQRLGSKPIGIVLNFVMREKGEVSEDEVSKMLELPVIGIIPFDDEVRRSFMQEKVSPVIVRKPSAPSSQAITRAAMRLTGKSVESVAEEKAGLIQSLLNSLRSLFGKS